MDMFNQVRVENEIIFPKQEVLSDVERKMSQLNKEERTRVELIASTINIADSTQVVNYGNAVQQNLDSFTQSILDAAKGKDVGETEELIASVVIQLKRLQIDDNAKGLKKIFNRGRNRILAIKAKYDSVSKNVEQVTQELEKHIITLYADLKIYEAMFEKNKGYYEELSMYIIAGKLAIEKAKKEAEKLHIQAQESELQEKIQEYNDLMGAIDRFERKITDLSTTKVISLQMVPQIRMLQNINCSLIDKISSTINNTIPLWKSQLILLLGEENSKKAVETQKLVSDITNQMLRKNAETLRLISVETARELDRGIVDVETLKETNAQLITTLDEVRAIQQEGKAKRATTEQELRKIEQELRQKILSFVDEDSSHASVVSNNAPIIEEAPHVLRLRK